MSERVRKRRDPRRETTRIALIEAAETMFAQAGLGQVSTRQIGAAIGSANNTVVAYHFGGKDALIEAIYNHRLPAIEARRRELLAQADASGPCSDIVMLLQVLWLPLFEQRNEAGQRSYARFLHAMLHEGVRRTRQVVASDFPTAIAVVERLSAQLPFAPGHAWDMRWRLATNLVLGAMEHIDNEIGDDLVHARPYFDEAVAMAASALTAPTGFPKPAQ